jgi:pantoate--beta-alanine ligase
MGGLHEGHLSLVRLSLRQTARTCVTLFVNPKQFGEGEDFDVYPRDEAADAALLAGEGAHLLYAPEVAEIYPPGSSVQVSVPGIGDLLEGEFRPGFFTGVATVVTKLLLQSRPDAAFFGEKDYQQLLVIRRLARDLDLAVEITGGPIVREADGLALSSRNAYLSPQERRVAPVLFKTLSDMATAISGGEAIRAQQDKAMAVLADAGFGPVDYVTVRDAATLEPLETLSRPARILAAARLGRTRLIDNVAL